MVRKEKGRYESVNSSRCFSTLSITYLAGSKEIEIIGVSIEHPPAVRPIYVDTDKNDYELGESIKMLGCTSLALDDKELFLEILNPEGKIYRTISVTPNIDGSFSTSLIVEGELAINGTYTAKTTYAGESATNTFVVPEFPLFGLIIFATAISLILVTRLMPKPHGR